MVQVFQPHSIPDPFRITTVLAAFGAGATDYHGFAGTYSPNASSGDFRGLYSEWLVHPVANHPQFTTGIFAQVNHDAGAFNLQGLRGGTFGTSQQVAGTTVIEQRAIEGSVSNVAGNTTLAIAGLFRRGAVGEVGAVVNYVGVQIDAVLGVVPTNNISIYAPDTLGYSTFGHKLVVGADTGPIGTETMSVYQKTPAANFTGLVLGEGSPEVMRTVKWKDGAAIGAGDKVMVLV